MNIYRQRRIRKQLEALDKKMQLEDKHTILNYIPMKELILAKQMFEDYNRAQDKIRAQELLALKAVVIPKGKEWNGNRSYATRRKYRTFKDVVK